jgi:hypothetical protein
MTMSLPSRRGPLVALAVTSLALTACGGSSHRPGRSSANKFPASSRTVGSSGGDAVTTGPVRARLTGQSHKPTVRQNWTYTVTATDAQGRPLSGTVETNFAFQGAVVGRETPPTHPLKNGHLKDVLNFPAESVGYPIELQVVVHTHLGSVTLNWPVTVSQ